MNQEYADIGSYIITKKSKLTLYFFQRKTKRCYFC